MAFADLQCVCSGSYGYSEVSIQSITPSSTEVDLVLPVFAMPCEQATPHRALHLRFTTHIFVLCVYMLRGSPKSPKNYWSAEENPALKMMNDSPSVEVGGGSSRDQAAVAPVLPKIALSEANLGRVLGTGGFSVVSEIKSLDLDEIYDTDDESAKARMQLACAIRDNNSSSSSKFVLKTLRNDLDEVEHEKGVSDLAIEAAFLQVLSHPHIITMRAAAHSDPHRSRYFVVLDKLTMTLERKFNLWRRIISENTGYWIPCYGYCCSNEIVLHASWKDRLQAAADISAALEYLHGQRIIYRDLKPDNIGFDAAGTLKLFDFGLAKRLDDAVRAPSDSGDGDGNTNNNNNDNYLLTGNTGSLRYMAPEVAVDQPYNESVDSYSFGILFWQICSLTTPFSGYSQQMHALQVVQRGERPKPDKSWPLSWCSLMEAAWSGDPRTRPAASELVAQVKESLLDLAEVDGVVPSRASEIRAKKRRSRVTNPQVAQQLDLDTRLAVPEAALPSSSSNGKQHHGFQRHDGADIV